MPLTKEIFKAGTWEDSKGTKLKFTEEDIDEIIASFDNDAGRTKEGRRVPLVAGHPETNEPARGWVGKLWREGKGLFASFVDISNEMMEALKTKAFREVSIALTGKTLRHVGVLGAVPPAVPALGDFKFEEGEEFEVYSQPESIFDKIRKTFTNNNEDDMKELTDALAKIATLEAGQKDLQAKFEAGEAEKTQLNEKIEKLEKENKEFKDGKEKAEKDLKEKIDAEANRNTEMADKEDEAAIDALVKEFKVAPAEKDAVLTTLKGLRGQEEKEFEQADGTKKKMSPRDNYMEALKGREQFVQKGEQFANGSNKAGKTKMQLLVDQKMKDDPKLSFSQASREVLMENPNITSEEDTVAA